jgi:uncharacterized protein DUF6101
MFETTTGGTISRERRPGNNPAGELIVRRQSAVGRIAPAGSSRDERLDPFTLPVRFAVNDKAADERVRYVELSRERVVVRRAVHGIKMAVNLPVSAFLGVAVRLEPPVDENDGAVTLVLEHRDPGLSLILYRANDGADIVAEWQSWARVLAVPMLVADVDGRLREPFARIGALRVSEPTARRRRRLAIKRRRPTIPMRRRCGRSVKGAPVHRGEREIIARN